MLFTLLVCYLLARFVSRLVKGLAESLNGRRDHDRIMRSRLHQVRQQMRAINHHVQQSASVGRQIFQEVQNRSVETETSTAAGT
jgi:hypothetical protein